MNETEINNERNKGKPEIKEDKEKMK